MGYLHLPDGHRRAANGHRLHSGGYPSAAAPNPSCEMGEET